ncbi:VanZ family protein [Streptomyces sp. TLI_171]|uniref:VanZ family protein n=1 Tax=Streptomyces sp. TLI_171 TaxID=1938859 RepID=UPI000C18D122|nr:VanZ family protein [Streptomyces sp. TLI_171]RKE19406.1 VanZ like protein [Streptomyces sp. TLI_171]
MIEASLSAAPALFPAFAVLGLIFGLVALRLARRKQRKPFTAVLLGLSLAGETAATLTPTISGSWGEPTCSIGSGVWDTAMTQQGLMNLAMYIPVAFFGVLVLRRPLTVLASCGVLSAATEVCQTLLGTGRSCDAADLVDNVVGALVGTVAAVVWLWLRRSEPLSGRRDVLHSLSTAGTGLAAVTAVIWLLVPLHRDAAGFVANPTRDQQETAERIAARLFGPGTRIESFGVVPDPKVSPRPVLKTVTDRGGFETEWPSGRLLVSASADTRVDAGPLTEDQVLEAGADFAAAWFSDLTSAANPTLASAGAEGAYLVTYRRYNGDNVLMPMRLDISVSTSGRIMASSARWDADPQLPHPTVTAEAAKQRAVSTLPGSRTDTTFLLAKQINGEWRPCWAVNLVKPGEDRSSGTVEFIDALTGQAVAHQG